MSVRTMVRAVPAAGTSKERAGRCRAMFRLWLRKPSISFPTLFTHYSASSGDIAATVLTSHVMVSSGIVLSHTRGASIMQYNCTGSYKSTMCPCIDAMGENPYECDTPNCSGDKEVITPDGYVCDFCAARLPVETREAK